MVSSEFPELLSVCDRIIVLHEGRQDAEFLYGEADEEILMAYASGTGKNYEKKGERAQ